MKKILNLLFKNFSWKLMSLLFAIVLWLICVTIENPLESSNPFYVSLILENKDKVLQNGFVIVNQDALNATKVKVTVRAYRSLVRALKESNVKAYIDLKPIDYTYENHLGENQALTVYPRLVNVANENDYQISISPYTVNVVLDKLITAHFPVTIDKMGDADDGYVSMQQVVVPESITVSGAQSAVEKIDSVRVPVNLKGATSNVVAVVKPTIYDAANKDITSQFTISPEEVTVTVSIDMYAKIPIRLNFTGNVAEGYTVTNFTQDVEYVELVGNKEDLELIKSIDLPPINLEGLTDNYTQPFDLRNYLMNTNLSIRNGTPNQVKVTAHIAKEAIREMDIPIEKVKIIGMGAAVESIPSSVALSVKGLAEIIDTLEEEDVSGMLDITGLGPGLHEVEVQFDLPKGVVQTGEASIVTIIIPEPSATPSEKETEAAPIQSSPQPASTPIG